MALELISAGLGIVSGLKGLFGSKPKERTPRDQILSQAQGAREAAEKYGFNPLTLLQSGAGAGFTQSGGSAPPLASVAAIQDGLRGIDDVLSGDQARRRQADQLELDLAKVKLDEAKRGVGYSQPRISTVPAAPLTGNRAAVVAQPTSRIVPPKLSYGQNPIAPGRKVEIAPVMNSPGVFEMDNAATGGSPITIPGEGEPWGLDELGTAVIVGAPQVLRNKAREFKEYRRDTDPEELRKRDKERAAYWANRPKGFLGMAKTAYDLFN